MYHARWCLSRAETERLADWVRAEGHEAIARAHTLQGELDDALWHAAEARRSVTRSTTPKTEKSCSPTSRPCPSTEMP